MRKLIFILILLAVPAFAQDDEPTRPVKLTEAERQRSVGTGHAGDWRNLRCIAQSDKPCQKSRQYEPTREQRERYEELKASGVKNWGQAPQPEEFDLVGVAVKAGLVILGAIWLIAEVRARR